MIITAGSTNKNLPVYFTDDDGGTAPGEPTTGLLFSDIETGGSASYHRQGAEQVDFTLVTLASASAAHTDGGFILIDDTKMPGLYRVDVPDAAFATGVDFVIIQLVAAGAKNTVMRPLLVDLTDVDLRDGVRGGMTALPNADADAAGGLPISDAGGLDLDARIDAAISSRLAPTTAGRTLDVTATGEAGIDLDNTVGTLAAAQIAAAAFTQSKFASSFIQSSSFATGALNAAAIATDAFTGVKFASGSLNGKGDWNVGKTGYTLTQTFPANFAALSIDVGGLVDILQSAADKVWGTGTRNLTALGFVLGAADFAAGSLDNKGNWNVGKTGYTLTQTFPTNFADMAIVAATGEVKVGSMNANVIDAASIAAGALSQSKFGSSFIQSSSFATGAINAAALASNAITAVKIAAAALNGKGDWNIGKAGYSLAATGLDLILSTATGMVAIARAVWDRVLTGLTHNDVDSAGRRLRILEEHGTYEGGAIWIDTINGTAGTTPFENGTNFKNVNNLADAVTLAASVGLSRFRVAPGSILTFAEAHTNELWIGEGWTLAFGGQNIGGSSFIGADVSGISLGEPHQLINCHLAISTLAGGQFTGCGLDDTVTFSGAVTYVLNDCFHSEVAAGSTIDFGAAVGVSEAHIHNWHGNLTILNMKAGDILHFTCADGSLTMDSTCTGGTRNSAGTFGLTDNSSGMTVNNLGQMYQRAGDIQLRLPAALIGGRMNSDMKAINGNATSAAQLALSAEQIENGACEGTPTTTVIQTDLAEPQDDIYIGRIVMFTSGNARGEATDITDYAGATGTLTVTALANAPADTDTFILI